MYYKPTFIGIGVQNSGTTWLAGCLQQHPEICMPRKELHFFNKHYETMGWQWYSGFFQPVNGYKAYGEWTPEYIFNDDAFRKICQDLSDIKIISMFRNPVDRVYSHYWRYRVAGFTRLDFYSALKEHPFFLQRSFYFDSWFRYADQFGKQNCLPLIFEEVKDKTVEEYANICRFLGVDPFFKPDFNNARRNKAQFNRSQRIVDALCFINDVCRSYRLGWAVDGAKKFHLKKMLEKINKKRDQYPSKLSQEEKKELLNIYFREEIRKFSDYIEKDLTIWNCV
jgi:hypothetical protein